MGRREISARGDASRRRPGRRPAAFAAYSAALRRRLRRRRRGRRTARYAAFAAAAAAAAAASRRRRFRPRRLLTPPPRRRRRRFIDSGRSAAELAGLPLWADGAPDWVAEIWRSLRRALLATNDGWEVWTEWYEARLAGDMAQPPNEALEIARATIADEIWKQGPTVVNAEIKRLIEEHKGPPPETGEADANDGSLEDQSGFDPILATRAVLRVLPLLATDERIGDRVKSKFVLSVFHALAVAWTRTVFPDLVSPDLSLAAARDISPVAPTTRSAALHIGQAATHAANSAGSRDRGAAASHKRAGDLQIRQSLQALTNPILFEGVVAQATTHDTEICSGFTPKQIGAIALWPGGDTPGVFLQQWHNLREALRFANEGWEVWIDWYEARLDGRLRSQEVELAYVNYIRNISQTATAWQANSEIKRLIDQAEQSVEVLIQGASAIGLAGDLSVRIDEQEPPQPGTHGTSTPWPSIESIPEQERTGTRFGMDGQGRIDVLQTPPTIDELQRLHYEEMRHKAQALSDLGQMLGDLAQDTFRILDALREGIEDVSIDKLWSRGNTLRRRHNAHVRTVDNNLGPDPARLHALVAEKLGDFIDSFNVYVIGDPRGLELDRIRLGPQDREAARKVVALAAPIAIAVTEAQSPATLAAQGTLTEQVGAAIDAPDDINGDQAAELARKTTGNFVSELLRQAYAPIHNSASSRAKQRLR